MACLFGTLVMDVVVLVVCIFAAVYVYCKVSFNYWKKRNVPYVKPTFPFGNFGDVIFLRTSVGLTLQNIYKELDGKKYGGTYALTRPCFMFRDPDIIKNVLVKDFASFHDHGYFMDEELEPLTGHLFSLSGKRWKNLRAKLTPTFTSGKMKMMFQTVVDCGLELGSILEKSASNEEDVEMKDILARYSTDVISSCAFGIQCNCLKNPDAEFRQWGRKLFSPSLKNAIKSFLDMIFPSLSRVLRVSSLDPSVSKYFRNMVEETVNYRERNNITRNDFMHLLIQIKNKVKIDEDNDSLKQNEYRTLVNNSIEEGLSINSLAAQCLVFFFAGYETSSTTITFCLYELSLHQDIQDRVRNEIDVVLQKHDGKLTYERIQQMEYLDKVVSETLRKYPPGPMLSRECTKEYKIPGTNVVLEKGLMTLISVYGLHHDPKYYPEPERFDPERFNEEEKAKRHHYVYLPFGEGPRICIGIRFGLMQIKVGLVSILSKYQMSVSKKTPIPIVIDPTSISLLPKGGMWLKIRKRLE